MTSKAKRTEKRRNLRAEWRVNVRTQRMAIAVTLVRVLEILDRESAYVSDKVIAILADRSVSS